MQGSSKIRQALFFKPSFEVADNELAIMDAYVPGQRRVLTATSFVDHHVHFLPEGVTDYVVLNPLLTKFVSQSFCNHWDRGRNLLYQHQNLEIRTFNAMATLHESPSCASWRQMLLLQPHAAPVTSTVDVNSFNPPYCLDAGQHFFRGGLTMTSLVNFSVAKIGRVAEVHLLPGLKVRFASWETSQRMPDSVRRVDER